MRHRVKRIDGKQLRRWPLPSMEGDDDKDARGRILIVAGCREMPGAAILAATAALRAGAGKLKVATAKSVAPLVATAIPEALVVGLEETPSGAISSACTNEVAHHANAADALVIGPGMSDEDTCTALMEELVPALRVPMVADAGALACVRERPRVFRSQQSGAVLTPHAGEMASMLGRPREAIQRAPVDAVVHAARTFGAVVALKGADTFLATPRGDVYRNDCGVVGLATSGSGDTLAGVVGGLLARGCPPLQAAAWGVHVHALAGAQLQRRMGVGFLARELLAEIPPIMNDM